MSHLKVVQCMYPADALTKSVPGVQMRSAMERSGYLYLTERSNGQMKLLDS